MQVGVWSTPGQSRGVTNNRPWNLFEPFISSLEANRTLIDIEEFSTLPAQVLESTPSGFVKFK